MLAYMGQAASAARRARPTLGLHSVIWLTWRQFRTQAAVVFGVLAVVAIVLAVTGPHLVSISDGYLKVCHADRTAASTNNPVLNTDNRLESRAQTLLLIAARAHRHLLGRTAHRPRAGDRHLPAGLDPDPSPAGAGWP